MIGAISKLINGTPMITMIPKVGEDFIRRIATKKNETNAPINLGIKSKAPDTRSTSFELIAETSPVETSRGKSAPNEIALSLINCCNRVAHDIQFEIALR